jgi:sarcosine/dimethylglycine N-methyltransferase
VSALGAPPYATGETVARIRAALLAAGHDPERLDPAELALLEDFHSSGRLATVALIDLLGPGADDRVLDAGSGIGGTARLLARERGCAVTALDLTAEYCDAARWLNDATGLTGRIEVVEGDVTALPFADGSFDIVLSQHVQMNVADKRGLYGEAARVLVPGGRLGIWDIVAGPVQPLEFPVPWAEHPAASQLVTAERLRSLLGEAGFREQHWEDPTEEAVAMTRALLAAGPPPLGLGVFVPDFARKAENLMRNLEQGRARLIRGVLSLPG